MKKKLIQVGSFETEPNFSIPKDYEYVFFDFLGSINYIKRNELDIMYTTKDENRIRLLKYKATFIRNFLLENCFRSANIIHLFLFYYLYNHGGFYLKSDAVLHHYPEDENFVALNENTDFEVISIENDNVYKKNFVNFEFKEIHNNLYSGFFGFCKGHFFLLDFLYEFCCKNSNDLNFTLYFMEKIQIYQWSENENECKTICASSSEERSPIHFYNFKHKNQKDILEKEEEAIIFYKNEIITTIYSKSNYKKYQLSKKYKPLTNQLSHIKIGITLDIPSCYTNLFSNGINQNSLFFCETLLNCGFSVKFIVRDDYMEEDDLLDKLFYDERFEYCMLKDSVKEQFDIFFIFGYMIGTREIEILREMGTKIIPYFCGNDYLMDTEKILYNQHPDKDGFKHLDSQEFEEIWSIPQMYEMNKDYWEIIYNTKCREIPFIWSPRVLYQLEKLHEASYFYSKKKMQKNIAILEPNISIMKWALPSVLICEKCYNDISKDSSIQQDIDKLVITNIKEKTEGILNDFNEDAFDKFFEKFSLSKKDKIIKTPRYPLFHALEKYDIDIVVSHQWGNPLNYLYMDLAWMGYPIIHNASLCSDIGYYYADFNYNDGSEILSLVIQGHDEYLKEYTFENRKILNRYLPENKELQQKYIDLIMEVLTKNESCSKL